mgnify:CR=1 FL=1
MADYFVGDVQGCFDALERLCAEVSFNPAKDVLWLTGDLIARGPDSLATLKYLYRHQDSVKTVLGNHDLHFLAVANGLKRVNPKDNLQPLLENAKLPKYIDWLRTQPLLRQLPEKSGYLSHAGLPPHWRPKLAKHWAKRVEERLSDKNYVEFLPLMYGNKPDRWHDNLTDTEKLKFTISAFTRMRYCFDDGALDFENKGVPEKLNKDANLKPWFDYDPKRFEKHLWIFGHWASLMGQTSTKRVIALDTGYVWGNQMTMLHWQSMEKIITQA